MKKNNRIVNYFICAALLFLLAIFLAGAINAQIPSPTPAGQENELHTILNFMGEVLGPGVTNTNNTSSAANPQSSGFIYYPQCDGQYDNVSLPNGCNICQSGCGPATLAMILSSLVDKKFTPDVVVNLYKQNGYYAGCDGTKITDAMNIALQNGLKTTDLMLYDGTGNDQAIQDFKSYINSGWTIFALGHYCSAGCKHYFWITNIDNNNNVWAYDPFYGRKLLPPPFDENKYYPFPQYTMAFGVKK